MDYHSDRFEDFSLMIYMGNSLIGLLPANLKDNTLYSHQGLTYGGLFLESNYSIDSIFIALRDYLIEFEIEYLKIRSLPVIYQSANSKRVTNYLQGISSILYHSNKVLAIDYSLPLNIHKTKLKHYRKNHIKGFEIREESSFESFWNRVLIPRLKSRHNTSPVHTLNEITLLKSRFIEQIKQYNIYLKGEILAGITIFDKGHVVKSQYGATNDLGENQRALEYLFIELIYKYKTEGKRYFSMGTVMDDAYPEGYNVGLMRQKIELGCKEYQQDYYEIKLV
ncbi:FemAB family protein [Winogradskyella alexanderae]|uniref:FemAB family protein n=1 Tax=Winogradskyella alexanderae TaxID=2877123 RepID=A0ABS7XV10_9FLAO|nr:FemAB family protein [Winogradskyella alexanderae]MCA0132861.1 FemAB family protein [Winogradskyella alexanderae]